MAIETYRDPLTCEQCGCFQSKHDAACPQWNEDGEQYRVIIRGEVFATFSDVEAAADAYADHACVSCWQPRNGPRAPAPSECCDVQTWTRS